VEIENMSPAALLDEVNKAIRVIMLGGQEYRIGGRYLKRADLNALRQLRNELQEQTGDDSGLLDNTMVAVFDRR
jgi:hypothetical protein